MALTKLTIRVEKKGAKLQFGSERTVIALFNPSHMKFSRTANWAGQATAQRDVPELQFTGAQPRSLVLDLMFDTYDSDKAIGDKQNVRELTDKLHKLTTVEEHGGKHRPPVCQLYWGKAGLMFQGVLSQMEEDLVLFTSNGTPVRAKVGCTFTEWRTGKADQTAEDTHSSDIAKVRVVRRGDSLASIAAEEYHDTRHWRTIAAANDIDDPLRLPAGRSLLLPTVPGPEIAS